MKFRLANYLDAKTIAEIHTESWRKYYANDLSCEYLEQFAPRERRELWDQRLAAPKPNQRVVVVEVGDDTVGFGCVFLDKNPRWGSYLDNLHVVGHYQSRGIGSALLKEVFRQCDENAKSKSLCLLVNQTNTRAQEFYIEQGAFNQEPSIWNAPDGSAVPTYWFVWNDVRDTKIKATVD